MLVVQKSLKRHLFEPVWIGAGLDSVAEDAIIDGACFYEQAPLEHGLGSWTSPLDEMKLKSK